MRICGDVNSLGKEQSRERRETIKGNLKSRLRTRYILIVTGNNDLITLKIILNIDYSGSANFPQRAARTGLCMVGGG
jgi:hypothetical protein